MVCLLSITKGWDEARLDDLREHLFTLQHGLRWFQLLPLLPGSMSSCSGFSLVRISFIQLSSNGLTIDTRPKDKI
jgi:hypothetical protein